jgi:hypothetical protein
MSAGPTLVMSSLPSLGLMLVLMAERLRTRIDGCPGQGFDVVHPPVEQLADGVPAGLAVAAAVDLGDELGQRPLGVPLAAANLALDIAVSAGLGIRLAEGHADLPRIGSPLADAAPHAAIYTGIVVRFWSSGPVPQI